MTVEFKILEESPQTIQKILNQWKHQYDLEIHATFLIDRLMTVLVTRKQKATKQIVPDKPTIHVPCNRKELFKHVNNKLTREKPIHNKIDPQDDYPF